MLRPLAAAIIAAPLLLTFFTDLRERLYLWVHERQYLAVIRGEASGEARHVLRFHDNVVFVIPCRMTDWFLVYQLTDGERSAAASDPDQQSFWKDRQPVRQSHLRGPWYGTWNVRRE